MKTLILASAFILFGLFVTYEINAEPWVANRYAQNCSACHSPSRRNVAPKDRRCTLACQGCHVNPQGGGMRNEYGVWNQQRWLRSFSHKKIRAKGTPAPLPFQKYGKMPKKPSRGQINSYEKYIKNGPKLVVTQSVEYDPLDHDKGDRQEHINVNSQGEFLARITEDDPWRLERRKFVYAGGDIRYFLISQDGDVIDGNGELPEEYKFMFAPMMADFYVRAKPVTENVGFVVESRYANSPVNNDHERMFTSGAQLRSAYMIIDDLPWASYFQYGLYRPQFGHFNPDHESLAQSMQHRNPGTSGVTSAYKHVYRAIGIGASPNVPFFNFNYLFKPETSDETTFRQEDGMVLSFGGRFVTMGASIMFSYWDTTAFNGTEEVKKNMYSLTGGMMFKDFVLNLDYTTIDIEFDPGSSDKGQVYTFESKYRLWREIYAVLNFAQGSTARDLTEGEASETMLGFKGYLLSGTELELLMISRQNRSGSPTPVDKSVDIVQLQAHLFF